MSTSRDHLLDLHGPVTMRLADGTLITPRLQKAVGLLVLLGTAPGLRRSRATLQDKLWSGKSEKDGNASLRYALWSLRKDLGDARDVILSNPGWVGLDSERVEVRRNAHAELAEGLDIDDPEFEAWLRDERLAQAPAAPASQVMFASRMTGAAPPSATLTVSPVLASGPALQAAGNMLLSTLAARVRQSCGAEIRVQPVPKPDLRGGRCLALSLAAVSRNGQTVGSLSLMDTLRGALLFSTEIAMRDGASLTGPHLPALVGRIVDAFLSAPPDADDAELASVALARAMTLPRTFAVETLRASADALATVDIRGLDATVKARRALVLGWLLIERGAQDPESTLEEALALGRLAVEDAPFDPDVLAIAAELTDFLRKPDLALDYARRAIAVDPRHPMANACLAKALARAGKPMAAYRQSLRSNRLAAGSSNAAWWAMLASVCAVGTGNLRQALRHAEHAHDLDPRFRAPVRFKIALSHGLREEETFRSSLCALGKLEPAFSPEMLYDPDYPLRSFDAAYLKKVSRAALG